MSSPSSTPVAVPDILSTRRQGETTEDGLWMLRCNYDARRDGISRAIIVAFFPRREQIASLARHLFVRLFLSLSQSSSSAFPSPLSAFGSENGNEPSSKKVFFPTTREEEGSCSPPVAAFSFLPLAHSFERLSFRRKDSKISVQIHCPPSPPSFLPLVHESRAQPPGLALWMRMDGWI